MPTRIIKKILPLKHRNDTAASLIVYLIVWLAILAALNQLSLKNYLFFHALTEIFSIVIASSIFTIAWNSRKIASNGYLLIIGVASLFVGMIDFVHIMAFKGMNVFPNISSNLATQLWVAARYVQSLSFLAAALWLYGKNRRHFSGLIIIFFYLAVTVLIFLSIFVWKNFPVAYVEGAGLTPFKKISEYIICGIFALSLLPLIARKEEFSKSIFWLIFSSIVTMIFSELFFTLYLDPYGFFNKIGHFLKIISFYLIYRAIVVANIENPFAFLLKDLKDKETVLSAALTRAIQTGEALKMTERAYREALVYTQSIIDTVKHPLLVIDEKLTVDSANKTFYKLFLTRPEDTEKKPLASLFDIKLDKQRLIQNIKQVILENSNFYDLEVDHDYPKIGRKILLFSGKKIKLPGNRPPLVLLSAEDITERKKMENDLQETKYYLEKLIKHANAPIIVWGPEFDIRQFNYAFEQLSGYKADEVIGRNIEILFPPGEEGTVLENIIYGAEGETRQNLEVPILCRDGQIKILLWSSANIYKYYFNKEKRELIATIAQGQDITELKRIEKSKNEFLSLASHELRTPLSTIWLSAEMLEKENADKMSEKSDQYLKNILKMSDEMRELIDAFLNVSRIEMGSFITDPRPANLIKMIDDILGEISPRAQAKRLKIKTSYDTDLPFISLDQKTVALIMKNLLTNAIKYSRPGDVITVQTVKDGEQVIIKISDTGLGIPKSQQNKIFEKMYRADNAKQTKNEGIGLGLYIVKFAVEQAGGKIWFESEENKGTTFSVAIPLSGMKEKK